MQKQKISTLTGGGGDFARATAIELGKKGPVLLGDIQEGALASVAKELELLGIEAYTMVMDVRDKSSCVDFAKKAASLGEVMNVVNIAGVSPQVSYTEETISSPELIFATNSIGAAYVTDAFLPIMAEGGSMVQIASQAGHYAQLNEQVLDIFDSCCEDGFLDRLLMLVPEGEEFTRAGVAYMMSKAFVLRYVRRNVKCFGKKGLRINSISPGMHWTTQVRAIDKAQREGMRDTQPIKRYGAPHEFASIVAFLCSGAASYTTGADILADGGGCYNRIAPQIG